MDTDVLVVGAGPTGLMLANQLGRRGVRVTIVDRHAGPSRETRALGVHARSLEIYARLGVVDRALELGTPGRGANMWANGRLMAHVPLGDAGRELTPYPFIHILGQDDNERILGDKLRDWGLAVQWNTELVDFTQHADHVEARLRALDGGTRSVTAAWLAGCDGARSTVREKCGIGFPGAPYEHIFFVADVEATGGMVPGELNVYMWRQGFHLFFPMRGTNHWRIVGILPPELTGREGLRFEDVAPSVRAEAGKALAVTRCSWFSTYKIHHRAAERFRAARAFLLGDAAHIHSPVGAQGMNTGLQDAYNLAWKLALVIQGRASPELLASYPAERMPIAQNLLRTTDQGFKLVVDDSWAAGLLRTQVIARVLALVMRVEGIQRRAFHTVSQIGIHYRKSALSETQGGFPSGAPRAGDRFPWLELRFEGGTAPQDVFGRLDDRRFTLIAVGQPERQALPPELAEITQSLVVPDDAANAASLQRAGIPSPSFYLLRPDGHVGLCGRTFDVEAVQRYARTHLHLI